MLFPRKKYFARSNESFSAPQLFIQQTTIKVAAVLGFGIVSVFSAAAQENFYYGQNFEVAGAYASDNASGWTMYDDFSLSSAVKITRLEWWGVLAPLGSAVNGFTVDFVSDDGGVPGSVLASDYVSGDAGQESTGAVESAGYTICSFGTTLSTPFTAAAGTDYFISIVASMRVGDWYWEWSATGNQGALEYNSSEGSSFMPVDVNGSFNLYGTVVPEPDTISLTVMGGAAFLLLRRRKKFQGYIRV